MQFTGSPHESRSKKASDDDNQLVLRIHRGRSYRGTNRPATNMGDTSVSTTTLTPFKSISEDVYQKLQLPSTSVQRTAAGERKRASSVRMTRPALERRTSDLQRQLLLESSPQAAQHPASSTMPRSSQSALENGERCLFQLHETSFDESTLTISLPRTNRATQKKSKSKRSARFQARRFKVETKAAKTLAIIVGGFIFCWLPFFTMYLIRAFCDHCIQPTVFSVLFWLGYCNSAINPLIYALFSHEFRLAFKRIVCRCVCTRSGFRASENFQTVAARALMAPATFHKTISGCSDDVEGDEDMIVGSGER